MNSKCPIKATIEALYEKFAKLDADVQKELRTVIENEPSLLLDITTFARRYVGENNLLTQDKIYDLFGKLQVHYDFLNCELIKAIINNFLEGHQLQADMKHYLEELDSFLDSPSLLDIKEFIEEGLIATHNGTETTCKVVIRLTGRWGKISFKVFQDVIHFIISKELIAHINIITGSFLVTFLAPASHSLNIAEKALTKTNFMHRVGIIEMYINDCGNDYYIMEPQDEDSTNYDHSLIEAAEGGYEFDVSVLIKLGANINYIHTEKGSTALTLASQNGHYQVVELLLKEHADVNQQRQDGVAALMLASKNGHYQVVELLLKEHADVNHQRQDGVTALMLASQDGHYQVVELLLKEHADVNHQRQDGVTALMLASQDGHYQVVELLLKEHADVNHQRQDGVTALMLASKNRHYQVVELLHKEHADINHQRQDGATALMLDGHYQSHRSLRSIDDIPQLIDLCAEVKIEKWFLLGLQLKLDEETMYDIRNDQAFPTEEDKRQRMFEKWLKEDKNATNGKLLHALRTKVIGENAVAEKYETMLRANKDISAKGNIYSLVCLC